MKPYDTVRCTDSSLAPTDINGVVVHAYDTGACEVEFVGRGLVVTIPNDKLRIAPRTIINEDGL